MNCGVNCDVPLLLDAVRENRLDYAAVLQDASTLVERVFLFYPEEDSEDEEETLLKLLYEAETKGEGTVEVTREAGRHCFPAKCKCCIMKQNHKKRVGEGRLLKWDGMGWMDVCRDRIGLPNGWAAVVTIALRSGF